MFKSCIGAVDEIDRLPELMGWFDNFRGEPTVTRAMDHPWKGLEEIELKLGINSFDFHHITFRSCLQYGLATPGALVSWLEAERILLSCCHNDRYPCSNPFVMLFYLIGFAELGGARIGYAGRIAQLLTRPQSWFREWDPGELCRNQTPPLSNPPGPRSGIL